MDWLKMSYSEGIVICRPILSSLLDVSPFVFVIHYSFWPTLDTTIKFGTYSLPIESNPPLNFLISYHKWYQNDGPANIWCASKANTT